MTDSLNTRSQLLYRRFSLTNCKENNFHGRQGYYAWSNYKPPE